MNLKDNANSKRLSEYINLLIFEDDGMRENTIDDILRRIETVFQDKTYLKRLSTSRQRWLDDDIETVTTEILQFLKTL